MRTASHALIVIVALHLALGFAYDWATPVLEASDEAAHYAVVRWLAQGHPLPAQDPNGPATHWEQEGSQPPLYYQLSAALTAWVDTADFEQVYVRNPFARVGIPGTSHNANLYKHTAAPAPLAGAVLGIKLVRWFSLLLSCVTIGLTFRLSRRIFPQGDAVAVLASALVAFNPMALFINASVNNDNLLMLLSTAAILVTLDLMQPDVRRYAWKVAGLGLLLGLAALTKLSGLVLWPVAAMGVGWGAWRAKAWRRVVLGAIAAGLALAVSGWWFWRNHQLYGEWLGLNTMVAVAGARVPPVSLLYLVRHEWASFWLSYWGIFGVFTLRAADWVYILFNVLSLWAVLGAAGAVVLAFRARQRSRWPEMTVLVAFIVLTLIGLIRWTMQTFASQGRLMFGAIAPLSIFMAAGILAAVPRHIISRTRSRAPDHFVWASGLGAFLAVLAAVIPFAYIAPRYAPPPVLAESNLPADLRPMHAVFGSRIELVGYVVGDMPQAPGGTQRVTLYWRALQSMDEDFAVALHLLGRGAEEVGKIDTWPGGGNLPTTQWTPGAIYADAYRLPIDPGAAAPSLLRLNLAIGSSDFRQSLSATTPEGVAGASVTMTVGRVAPTQSPTFAPAIVEGSYFEYGIQLVGLDAETNGTVTMYWRTDQPVPVDYTLFVHVLDARGVQVTQADGPPLNSDWPTSAWIAGQPFADVRHVELTPGRYTLHVGFYDPASGARILAFHSDGTPWPDDAVVLQEVLEIK